jgi:hypothetical protein
MPAMGWAGHGWEKKNLGWVLYCLVWIPPIIALILGYKMARLIRHLIDHKLGDTMARLTPHLIARTLGYTIARIIPA